MRNRRHIVIVDDEPVARMTLSAYFESAGYRVTEAEDTDAMRAALAKADVDLVLLDIVMPGEDGLSALRELRRTSSVPVFFVTNRSDEIDRVVGLEMGAIDYVVKPVNTRELLARVKNVLSLLTTARERRERMTRRRFDGWVLDEGARLLFAPDGSEIATTRAEFDLLAAFLARRGRVLERDALLDIASRGERDWRDRTVDALVGRLRRKIEDNPKAPRKLITVHGVGYVFRGDVAVEYA